MFKIKNQEGKGEFIMTKTNNKGFSLVELIIVVAIMAILIGVLAPQYIKYVEKSRVSSDQDLIDSLEKAMQTAVSDDEYYSAIAVDNSITITGGATGGVVVNPTSGGLADALKEFYGTIGTDKKFKSKEYEGATCTLTVKQVTTTGGTDVLQVEKKVSGTTSTKNDIT